MRNYYSGLYTDNKNSVTPLATRQTDIHLRTELYRCSFEASGLLSYLIPVFSSSVLLVRSKSLCTSHMISEDCCHLTGIALRR